MQVIFGQEYSNTTCNIEGFMNGVLKLNGSVVIGKKESFIHTIKKVALGAAIYYI